jgi:hypothetical protein
MTTIIIDDKSVSARKMIEFLKTQRYATIIDDSEPNASLRESMKEASEGKTQEIMDIEEYFNKVRKRANV